MASEGTKLLAEGNIVTLSDDVPRRVIFDMEALAVIEERMGSLSAYVEGLRRGMKGKYVSSALAGLEAGLRHYRDERGGPLLNRRQVSGLMQFDRLDRYVNALDEAWAEGIPMAEPAPGKVEASKSARRSRGKSSSGESRSSTTAATRSSGE